MAGILGSIIGNSAAGGDSDAQKHALQDALNNIKNINTPTISEQELALQNEQSAGKLTPAQEQAVQQQSSQLNNVSVNPALRAAQMQALQSLQQQSTQGLSASDKLALTQIGQQNSQQANSANQAVLQNAAARGMGGSGATLAAQLANNQNSANNQQNKSMQVAAQAQQNALSATAQAGQLGNSLEQSQYGESSNAARAQDAINQFNTANKQGVNAQNTLAQNQANAYNQQNAQNISNTNTNLANQQQQYNKGLYQTQYNNQMGQAQAEQNAENNIAGYYGQQAANTRAEGAAIGSGIDKAGAAIFTGGASAAAPAAGGAAASETTMPSSQDWSDYAHSSQGDPNAGWAHGGLIPQAPAAPKLVQAPAMHPIKIFKMLSPTGHNQMYADGGVVAPDNVQSRMAALQRGANTVVAPQQAQRSYGDNGVGAEDAADIGINAAEMAKTQAALAAFNARNAAAAQGYADGGTVTKPSLGSLIGFPGSVPAPAPSPAPKNYMTGGPVKGPEIVKGDSPKNDVVKAELSGGELVIPKSIVASKNEDVIMAFVKGAMSGKGK